jgi:hypothetical protein
VIIEPLPLSAPFEQVCAGTRPFLRVKLPMHTEAAEVLALQREMGWRDVQGVPARARCPELFYDFATGCQDANLHYKSSSSICNHR